MIKLSNPDAARLGDDYVLRDLILKSVRYRVFYYVQGQLEFEVYDFFEAMFKEMRIADLARFSNPQNSMR